MNLKNKKVVITGATVNRKCLKLNSFDASIVDTGKNEEKLENLKKKFPIVHIE